VEKQVPPGLDPEAVARLLGPAVGGLAGPLRAELIAGGRSNLTYVVGDGERRWVLRRPPLAHVLPTAHDMVREHRVISALCGTGIPVPRTVLLGDDPAVLGVPFYVMELVEGHVVRDRLPEAWPDTPGTRRRMSTALITTLARLHAVDPQGVGLGDVGRPAGFLERQVRRWWRQWELSRTRDLPEMEELRRRLEAGLPVSGAPAIVHGDYRLDNLILAPDDPGRVAAVLDWEMCTLGDPLADLGLLMVYWTEPDDEAALVGLTPTTAPGFATKAELRDRYAQMSGRSLEQLDFYVAFGYWKLACIVQGVYARYAGGAAAGDRSSVDGFARSVVTLAEMAQRALVQD
jgi:aminoglycoside phosphotransferase (APT) family kinase protein